MNYDVQYTNPIFSFEFEALTLTKAQWQSDKRTGRKSTADSSDSYTHYH